MEYILGFAILIVIMITITVVMKKRYNNDAKEAPKGEMDDGGDNGDGDGGDGGGN